MMSSYLNLSYFKSTFRGIVSLLEGVKSLTLQLTEITGLFSGHAR